MQVFSAAQQLSSTIVSAVGLSVRFRLIQQLLDSNFGLFVLARNRSMNDSRITLLLNNIPLRSMLLNGGVHLPKTQLAT